MDSAACLRFKSSNAIARLRLAKSVKTRQVGQPEGWFPGHVSVTDLDKCQLSA
jgi:hypothetical protein